MTKLFKFLFGEDGSKRDTDVDVEKSKSRVREAVKGLERDVLVLVAEALRPLEHPEREH